MRRGEMGIGEDVKGFGIRLTAVSLKADDKGWTLK